MNGYIRSCCGGISIGVIPNTTFQFIARLPVIVNMQFNHYLISLETLTDGITCNMHNQHPKYINIMIIKQLLTVNSV